MKNVTIFRENCVFYNADNSSGNPKHQSRGRELRGVQRYTGEAAVRDQPRDNLRY